MEAPSDEEVDFRVDPCHVLLDGIPIVNSIPEQVFVNYRKAISRRQGEKHEPVVSVPKTGESAELFEDLLVHEERRSGHEMID